MRLVSSPTRRIPHGSHKQVGEARLNKVFIAEFSVMSKTRAYQPGLFLSVSPDSGEGSRMSWVGLEDTADGIQVSVNDTPDVDGKFVAHPGPLLSHSTPHEIRFWIKVNQGPDNDLVRISVDGEDLGQCFTTWENYYRTAPEQAPPPNRNTPATINSLQFRSSVAGPPALAGNGYLFDNVSITPSHGPGPPGCDVPIEKTADSPTVTAGGRAGYRITVRNRGRLAARNLRACDRIPRQMTFVSADRRLRRIGRQRCLAIPRLQPGQRVSFHLVLQVNANAPQGSGDEHRRGHAASGNDALARAGVAGQPGRAARGHRDAQTHRDRQGHRENRQARAGSAVQQHGRRSPDNRHRS